MGRSRPGAQFEEGEGARTRRRIAGAPRGRNLTAGERAGLSPGLLGALDRAGTCPRIIAGAHPGAILAALWRRRVPVLTRGPLIFWPDAPADASADGRIADLALLQHELQHVLDYAEGHLTAVRYLANPRNWSYRLSPAPLRWAELGAEQRAVAAERLLLAQRNLLPPSERAGLEALLPWAQRPEPDPGGGGRLGRTASRP